MTLHHVRIHGGIRPGLEIDGHEFHATSATITFDPREIPALVVALPLTRTDIDIAKASWANQFLPQPVPPPGPFRHVADGKQSLAQIAAAKAAGMGIILIDQTPGLHLFAAGLADVADVENFAGTPQAAAAAVALRQAHKWESTLYISYNSLPALKAAIRNPAGVLYGVADYSWSWQQSEQLLNEHPDWAYTQYGDPASNPNTLGPGTTVTLQQAQADIDIAKASWAAEFLPVILPVPAPIPAVITDGILRSPTMGWTGHKMKSADQGETWTEVNE